MSALHPVLLPSILLLVSLAPAIAEEINAEYAFAKDGVITQINGGNVPGAPMTPPASAMFGPSPSEP